MPLKKTVDATLSTFNAIFDKFKSEAPNNKSNLILFLPFTNRSWCPDCMQAEAVILNKLESSVDDVALLRDYVGDRHTWRNPHHPWRVDPTFMLKGVPTLVLWENVRLRVSLKTMKHTLKKRLMHFSPVNEHLYGQHGFTMDNKVLLTAYEI